MSRPDEVKIVSLNDSLVTDLPIAEFDEAISVEELEERDEMGAASPACLLVYWGDCKEVF
jgi:hypothetical protein